MNFLEFFNFYKNLPTRADQKEVRHEILRKCKIKKSTFYSWFDRQNIPDEKARNNIAEIVEDFKFKTV